MKLGNSSSLTLWTAASLMSLVLDCPPPPPPRIFFFFIFFLAFGSKNVSECVTFLQSSFCPGISAYATLVHSGLQHSEFC